MSTEDTLNPLVGRRLYLVTYSQANLELFPTRESFGQMLQEEFNAGQGKVKVEYWACCKETHKDGGFHYHCSLKLSGCKKWKSVKTNVSKKYGVQLNFSGTHNFYLSAYRYICKEDTDVSHSSYHPKDLLTENSPKTKNAIRAYKAGEKRSSDKSKQTSTNQGNKKQKQKRLSNMDVATFITENKISSYTELLAVAQSRRGAGQNDIAEYVFNRSEKHLRELIVKAHQMTKAQDQLEEDKITRIELVQRAASNPCSQACNGEWLRCAKEVLMLNSITLDDFSNSLYKLLVHGRGKHRNIIIIGPANCAKTFIFKPLQVIFKEKLFQNPANDKYAWVNADKAQVMLLNDFRWTKKIISWSDLLLLLEGEEVKLPAPKNIYSEDVKITSDVSIFATSKTKISFRGPYNATDDMENQMMNVRWKTYKFGHVFPPDVQRDIQPCGRCFASLVFLSQQP